MPNPDFSQELNEYQYILFKTKLGQPGRDYLKQRNISPETARFWNLGFAPNNYTPACYQPLLKENVAKFWKKMNARLIIPIYDQNGKLLSLSGRTILKDKFPKYDHYPFPAKRVLFGLYQNKNVIREENLAIITEGQIDVISAWQKKIRTVTSSFGAHTSQEHFALLGRYTNNIFVIFDSDAAGSRGAKNSKYIKKADLNIKECVGLFPSSMDMDNWVRTGTKEQLYEMLQGSTRNKLKEKLQKLMNHTLEDF